MSETNDAVLDIPADDIAMAGGGELEYAGFWSRVAALIVDNAIVTIFGLALLIAAAFVGAGAVAIANVAYVLVAILYWPLMECSERQATIGKQLLGIQVTDANGARLTFVRSLLRNIAKILSSLPFGLGFLLAAFTARKQALHDLITKCLVVRAGPSHFLKAVVATVGALVISIGGGYYYFTEVYLPQMTQEMGQQMEKAKKEAQKGAPPTKPAPVQPPVAQAPTPAPAAQPAPEKAAPGEPKLMTSQEIAEFEKRMEQAKREPAKVAAVTPPAPAPAPAPEQKPAAPTPAKPAAVDSKPAPAKPAVAPVMTEAKPKPAAAPAGKAKPAPKPAAPPAAKPKPAPAPVAEASSALVSEPPAPPPAPRAAQPKPAVPAAVVVAPAPTRVRWPKFNDVMTAVMYRDVAAAAELLELGWWVDRPDSNRVTPLMAAAWIGDVAMTQLLLKGGADPNGRAPGGSVLDYAGRGGDAQVIELLKRSGAR